jgi:cobyrinic acid a,c-diamide synthase
MAGCWERAPTAPSSARASDDADLSIIEGMMGLFDGSSPIHEQGSTAELAKQLSAPVLLVIDGSAMARSAAAMASGFAKFDPTVRVAGILFNRVRSEGHYRLLRDAVEAETDLMVVGYLRPDDCFTIQDRHLGLRTAIEQGACDLYDRLARSATDTIDVERVATLARSAGAFPGEHLSVTKSAATPQEVRVGVAYDAAFCFYYRRQPGDAERRRGPSSSCFRRCAMAQSARCRICSISVAGYPELYGEALAANVGMRSAVRAFSDQGAERSMPSVAG